MHITHLIPDQIQKLIKDGPQRQMSASGPLRPIVVDAVSPDHELFQRRSLEHENKSAQLSRELAALEQASADLEVLAAQYVVLRAAGVEGIDAPEAEVARARANINSSLADRRERLADIRNNPPQEPPKGATIAQLVGDALGRPVKSVSRREVTFEDGSTVRMVDLAQAPEVRGRIEARKREAEARETEAFESENKVRAMAGKVPLRRDQWRPNRT